VEAGGVERTGADSNSLSIAAGSGLVHTWVYDLVFQSTTDRAWWDMGRPSWVLHRACTSITSCLLLTFCSHSYRLIYSCRCMLVSFSVVCARSWLFSLVSQLYTLEHTFLTCSTLSCPSALGTFPCGCVSSHFQLVRVRFTCLHSFALIHVGSYFHGAWP